MRQFYRRWWRPIAAALIIGASAWCAAGTVAVISAHDESPRLVALAPWWVAVLAAALALLVPGWRARPLSAVPALLSTLPWWPVPVPAEALVWTGALAWVPIAAALLMAEGARVTAALARIPGALDPARATRLSAVGALVIAVAAAWGLDPRVPYGDEPHYLVITQSLLHDADLQIENNHRAREYAEYHPADLPPDFLVRGQNRAIYSVHAPGLPALVLPGFAALGFRGAQATLVLIFALTGALVWNAAWRLTGETSSAWFAWGAVMTSTTMALLSFMVFPDAPAACAVAAAVWLLVSPAMASVRALVMVSVALAMLPWLHARFSVLAGVCGAIIVFLLLADQRRVWITRLRRAGWFLLVPIVSAALWLWSFWAIYGTIDPRAPYGDNPELRSWIWGALAGLFIDQQFGLLTYAPVLAVAIAAVAMQAPRAWRGRSAACLVAIALYAIVVSTYWMWWAGLPGLPARFLTAAVPLLAIPLGVVWSRSSAAGRSALLALLAISIATTATLLAVDRGGLAWNQRDGHAAWLEWLNPLINFPRVWPSFFWKGEGAFLQHAALLAMVFGLLWMRVRLWARRRAADGVQVRGAVVAWLLAGTMLMAAGGWRLTGTAPIDAARAQFDVHRAAGEGRVVGQIGPGITRWSPANAPLQIAGEQAPLAAPGSSLVFRVTGVPAGAYRIDVSSAGTLSGELVVKIGQSPAPWVRYALEPLSQQALPLVLPVGAAVLMIEAPRAGDARVFLEPVSPARPGRQLASQFARFPSGTVFSLDSHVFLEADGFWVKGSTTAALILTRGPAEAGRTRALHLRNGGAANIVTLRSGAWKDVLSLAAGEERAVVLPAANALGAWPLTITSSSGFQPSVTSGSTDSRYLGVWVQ